MVVKLLWRNVRGNPVLTEQKLVPVGLDSVIDQPPQRQPHHHHQPQHVADRESEHGASPTKPKTEDGNTPNHPKHDELSDVEPTISGRIKSQRPTAAWECSRRYDNHQRAEAVTHYWPSPIALSRHLQNCCQAEEPLLEDRSTIALL